MSTQNLQLEGYSTKEIALQQKPINEVLKESEGVLISFTKANVKKNLTALVKKHSKEIDELIAKERLTTKEESRLKELRAIYKEPRIALDKITKHNISVLAQTSKGIKVVKDELTLIVEPIEDKITLRLENEATRREQTRIEKEKEELRKKELIETLINTEKAKLQLIIDEFSDFELIDETIFNFENTAQIFRDSEKEEGIDIEAVNLEFESAFLTLSEALQTKIDTITTQYNLDQSNKALEVQKLTNSRMMELFDYDYKYKGEKELGSLSVEDYAIELKCAKFYFRKKAIEAIGMLGNDQLKSWIYATDTEVILVSINFDEVQNLTDEQFNEKIEFFKKEIEDWNNPKEEIPFTKTNEIQVESINGINEIISESEIEVKEEIVVEKIEDLVIQAKEYIKNKVELTAIQSLKKEIHNLYDRDSLSYENVIEAIEKSQSIERANLIEAYNDAQQNTFNLIYEQLSSNNAGKELMFKFEEIKCSINQMESVDYVQEKYGI